MAGSSYPFWRMITMDRLAISPEPFIQKCMSLARFRLALIVGPEDGSVDFMDRAEAIGLGISYDMLLDALAEAEVATSMNGRYPINDAIRQRLRKLLKC
jgi:hypothetical protein